MGPLKNTAPATKGTETQMPTFETNHPIVLSIKLGQGAVYVIASDRTDTVVAVNPSDRDRPEDVEAAAKTVIDLVDGTLSITAPKWRNLAANLGRNARGSSLEITVELPERSSLRAEAGFVDFRCDGRLDDVEVKADAGDVRLDQTGPLQLRSGAGKIAIGEASDRAEVVATGDMTIGVVAGDADIKNRQGKTRIGRVGGNVKVRSANGEIVVEDAGGDVALKSANGDIRLGQVARGSVSVETASGGVEIGVKEGMAAWIDAATKFGHFQNDLTAAEEPEQSAETVRVRARTQFGDVLITRS